MKGVVVVVVEEGTGWGGTEGREGGAGGRDEDARVEEVGVGTGIGGG